MEPSIRPGRWTSPSFARPWRRAVEGAFAALALLLAGCATPPAPSPNVRLNETLPADAFLTQRGLLTLRGREFALNGYLARSRTQGMRLIVTETFGAILADVLIKPDGRVFLMRSDTKLRPKWIRHYLAADLQCLFGEFGGADCPVETPEPGRYRMQRRRYELDVRIVETRPGPQAAGLFDETKGETP